MSVRNEAKSVHCYTRYSFSLFAFLSSCHFAPLLLCFFFVCFFVCLLFIYLFVCQRGVCATCPSRQRCAASASIYAWKWIVYTHLSMNTHSHTLSHTLTHTRALSHSHTLIVLQLCYISIKWIRFSPKKITLTFLTFYNNWVYIWVCVCVCVVIDIFDCTSKNCIQFETVHNIR